MLLLQNLLEKVGYRSSNVFFKNNAFVYQFVYSTLFLKYFCRIDNKAIESKCCFELAFNNYNTKKNGYSLMQKTPNIVKIEDKDCNSLIVQVGSDTSDENIKKKQRQT